MLAAEAALLEHRGLVLVPDGPEALLGVAALAKVQRLVDLGLGLPKGLVQGAAPALGLLEPRDDVIGLASGVAEVLAKMGDGAHVALPACLTAGAPSVWQRWGVSEFSWVDKLRMSKSPVLPLRSFVSWVDEYGP